jgi:serine protease Do
VLVQEVAPGSPASSAGIKPGDIITALGNGPIDDPQGLNFRIITTGIGVPVNVTLWREGKQMILPITFVAPAAEAPGQKVTLKDGPLKGITVTMLTPQIAAKLHLKSSEPRVVVLSGGGDMGMGMGAEEGDIIVAVNGKEIHSIAELERSLPARSRSFELTLVRGGLVLTMSVRR